MSISQVDKNEIQFKTFPFQSVYPFCAFNPPHSIPPFMFLELEENSTGFKSELISYHPYQELPTFSEYFTHT